MNALTSIVHCKITVGIVSLAMLFNAMAPACLVRPGDYDDLVKIVASQAVLEEFFYHSTLPVKMANRIIGELLQPGRTPEHAAGRTGEKRSENGSRPSSDSAILSSFHKFSLSRNGIGGGNEHPARLVCLPETAVFDPSAIRNYGIQQIHFIGVFLLMFFFLLPRSGLSADKIAMFVQGAQKIQPR